MFQELQPSDHNLNIQANFSDEVKVITLDDNLEKQIPIIEKKKSNRKKVFGCLN
jgi:hypothetical protein